MAGALVETGDPWEPYRLSDPDGGRVEPVSEFLRDLQAAGRPETTQRSYSLALLRFLSALGVSTGVGVSSDDSLGRCRSVATPGGPVSRFPAIRAA
ncbi:MAG: hypothetical protein ACRDOK_24770 [Streptosporangiaceae bacterium]